MEETVSFRINYMLMGSEMILSHQLYEFDILPLAYHQISDDFLIGYNYMEIILLKV